MSDVTKAEATAARVEQMAGEVLAEGKADRLEGAGGPTKTAKGIAMAAIAAEEGVKTESVRMRVHRAKKKASTPEWQFKDLGMQLDPEWLAKILALREALTVVANKLHAAQTGLTQLVGNQAPLPGRVAHVREDLKHLSALIRGLRPESVCPYCRGLARVMDECGACETLGYCDEAHVANVPKEYWDEERAIVLFRTEKVPVSKFVDGIGEESEELWPT